MYNIMVRLFDQGSGFAEIVALLYLYANKAF